MESIQVSLLTLVLFIFVVFQTVYSVQANEIEPTVSKEEMGEIIQEMLDANMIDNSSAESAMGKIDTMSEEEWVELQGSEEKNLEDSSTEGNAQI